MPRNALPRNPPVRPTKGAPSKGPKRLRVIVGRGAGFCSGVKRALKMALAAAERTSGGVYTFGPLIHNPQVVGNLRQAGVRTLSRVSGRGGRAGAKEGLLIIRSHGVSPAQTARAKALGYRIIDATCPFVRKAQENARRLYLMGYQVLIIGEKHHPEVRGIRGYVPGKSRVVESASQAKRLKFGPRVGIIAQTTIPVDTFASAVSQVAKQTREVLVFNTICSETARRQDSARDLAGEVDVLLVVGGRNSANTARLSGLCRSICRSTYHIETADEIDGRWFRAGSTVGVVTGASTPRWLVDSVVKRLGKL